MTSQEKLELIQEIADEAKAQRIETVDLRGKTVMWDAFLVCSGTSDVHVRSIADRIEEQMRNHKEKRATLKEEAAVGFFLILEMSLAMSCAKTSGSTTISSRFGKRRRNARTS